VKSYIHIRDVSKGELAILERGRIGERYHLSPDGGVSVRDVVSILCELQGIPFAQQCVSVAERPGQDAAYVIDSSKARSELAWRPEISLNEGLQETIGWVSEHWEEVAKQSLNYNHKA
jgi:dTDP-glucose 4,6-dehydratase